jgi:hypothetical protein
MILSFSAFASDGTQTVDGIMGVLGLIGDFFYSIYLFIFDYLPSLIVQFFVWLSAFALKIKFYFMYEGLVFAHSIATTFLELIDISSFVNSAISALPQDMKQLASDFRFFEALTLVVEAWITKLVYSGSS